MSGTPSPKAAPVWRVLEWVPRLIVAGVFAYTGLVKLQRLDGFVKEVRAYELIPLAWSNGLAYVLPWLELVTAVMLVSGLWRREARLLLAAMLVVFTAAKSYALVQGRLHACGCLPTDNFLYFLFDRWTGVGTNVVLLACLGVEAWAGTARRRRAAQRAATAADAGTQASASPSRIANSVSSTRS